MLLRYPILVLCALLTVTPTLAIQMTGVKSKQQTHKTPKTVKTLPSNFSDNLGSAEIESEHTRRFLAQGNDDLGTPFTELVTESSRIVLEMLVDPPGVCEVQ